MFTKAFYQKLTHFFQVSLKVHCLKWQGNCVYNKSIKLKTMLLTFFVICSLFLRKKTSIKIINRTWCEIQFLGHIAQPYSHEMVAGAGHGHCVCSHQLHYGRSQQCPRSGSLICLGSTSPELPKVKSICTIKIKQNRKSDSETAYWTHPFSN